MREVSPHTDSFVETHADGDPFDPSKTTVVIDGWNYSSRTSTADPGFTTVSAFRVLDPVGVRNGDSPWKTEKHPTLDGVRYETTDANKEAARKAAYEAGVLGLFTFVPRKREVTA